jgi:tetratricopeptide (TPR) repeat protein
MPAEHRTASPLAPAALLAALALAGCRHTYEKVQEVPEEEQLELYTTTATYLYEDGELLRAREQALKALEIEPEHRAMRRMIGWIGLRLGSNEDVLVSERFFRDLIGEGDDNENTRLGLAITCERLGKKYDDVSRAIAAGERQPAGAKEPEQEARELAARARAYWQEGIALLEKSLASGEGTTNSMNALQRLHALAGHYEESLGWSTRLLERTDAELAAWREMLQQEDLTEREERLFRENERAAVELQTETHLFAATLLFRLGRHEESLAHLDAVVRESPELPQVYSMRGQLRHRIGRYAEALEDLDRYLALSDAAFEHPDVQRAFELRAECEKSLAAH